VQDISAAAAIIRAGGLVAYPTETFYGIAADPEQPAALARLVQLKGRDGAKAIPLIAGSRQAVEAQVAPLSGPGSLLADAFWPGPLTLVIRPQSQWSAVMTGPTHGIGLRVPGLESARTLAAAVGGLITSTSANFSGEPPVTEAGALAHLTSRGLDAILDLGPTAGGSPSTVIDLTGEQPVLVRPGAVAQGAIERVLGVRIERSF